VLLSSKGGAEGIGIKRGQGQIMVLEASSGSTLSQLMRYYVAGASVLTTNDLRNVGSPATGCSLLKQVVSSEEFIADGDSPISVPKIINTDIFCEVKDRKFVTLLRNVGRR
jgi:hypothetical protein